MYDPDSLDNRSEKTLMRLVPVIDAFARYHRAEVRGVERIPDGPALFVGNHSGATLSIDTFILAGAIFRERGLDYLPFGLAHDFAMTVPGINELLSEVGAVRANEKNAAALFAAGRKVMVYPGGDVDAMRPFRARNEVRFDGRAGFARLAIRHGVPIVPVCAHGAHGTLIIFDDLRWLSRALGVDRRFRLKVFPVSWSIPWGFWVGPVPPYFPLPTRITIEVLDA
ncbi:MAG: acyltransferase family protein, partial [Myxococcales bacterium]|nr:acyltransferase family protein [Myxococcales bacterium]